jgi:hypothetical protein
MFSATMTGLWLLVCAGWLRCGDVPRDGKDLACELLALALKYSTAQCEAQNIPCSPSSKSGFSCFLFFCAPAISYAHAIARRRPTKLTGAIFADSTGIGAASSSLGSSSLSSCSVMRGGGSCGGSRCGDSSGLAGSGMRCGVTSASSTDVACSTDAEISSMFFLWIRSSREGRVWRRGRRPSMQCRLKSSRRGSSSTSLSVGALTRSCTSTPHHHGTCWASITYFTDHGSDLVCSRWGW